MRSGNLLLAKDEGSSSRCSADRNTGLGKNTCRVSVRGQGPVQRRAFSSAKYMKPRWITPSR
ncbi:hypothetical protein AVEN_224151-1, partial [Araneus ventricosus]